MGFDRGVHAFKNFVLRGQKPYYDKALREFHLALEEIDGYKNLPNVTEKERELLGVVETTILAYLDKLSVIQKMKNKSQAIKVIDSLVRIDDSPASAALSQLQEIITQKRLTESEQVAAIQTRSFLILFCIFLLALILSVALSKTFSSKIVHSINKLLSLSRKISSGDYLSNGIDLNTFADDELKSLASQMMTMNKILKDSFEKLKIKNDELKHFAFTTSHDLQEPIKKISTYSGLLKFELGDRLDRDSALYMHEIEDSTQRMIKLIRSLLKLSQLTYSEIKFGSVDLNEVIDINVKKFQELLDSTNGKILYQNLPVIEGNKELLDNLFQNLISNAIKYRSPQRDILITIESELTPHSPKVKIRFSDNGIGIEQVNLAKIFRPFIRLENDSNKKGQGIGLYQCKKIVELHGGNLCVSSIVDKETIFTFELSLA
tara:strand:+ start:3517 stop:4815 length:1299 start_codon:yes stop_codon:yes gene_type:complete